MKQKLILNYNASLGMKYCGEILKTLAIVFIASRLNASSEFIFVIGNFAVSKNGKVN